MHLTAKTRFALLALLIAWCVALWGAMAHAAIYSGSSYKLTLRDAEKAVAQSLQEDGYGDKIRVMIPSGGIRQPLAEYNTDVKVYVQKLEVDNDQQRFSSTLMFEADGKAMAPIDVKGRYEVLQTLPVLNRAIRSGQMIAKEDLTSFDTPINRVQKNVATDEAQLIGKTAARTISPRRPVRMEELENPAAVQKNSGVSLIYRAHNLEIRGMGEALDAGAVGDSIRVRNAESKVIVQGIVQDAHTVIMAGSQAQPAPAPAPSPAKTAARPAYVVNATTAAREDDPLTVPESADTLPESLEPEVLAPASTN